MTIFVWRCSPCLLHRRGFVIDGFPRMRSSSIFLEGGPYHIVRAVHLKVSAEQIAVRLAGRVLDDHGRKARAGVSIENADKSKAIRITRRCDRRQTA